MKEEAKQLAAETYGADVAHFSKNEARSARMRRYFQTLAKRSVTARNVHKEWACHDNSRRMAVYLKPEIDAPLEIEDRRHAGAPGRDDHGTSRCEGDLHCKFHLLQHNVASERAGRRLPRTWHSADRRRSMVLPPRVLRSAPSMR